MWWEVLIVALFGLLLLGLYRLTAAVGSLERTMLAAFQIETRPDEGDDVRFVATSSADPANRTEPDDVLGEV